MCVCVFVKSRVPEKKHVSDLSKPDALLHKTHQGPSGTKVPRLDMCRSILSLSKTAHEMFRGLGGLGEI